MIKRFAGDKAIGFTLLSDAKSKMIAAFDLLDPNFPPASRWHGLARAMIVVLDRAGTVRGRFSGRNNRDRPNIDMMLDRLR